MHIEEDEDDLTQLSRSHAILIKIQTTSTTAINEIK